MVEIPGHCSSKRRKTCQFPSWPSQLCPKHKAVTRHHHYYRWWRGVSRPATRCRPHALQNVLLRFSQISSHPIVVQYYTGLPDAASVLVWEALLSKFEWQYHSDWPVQKMSLVDQLLLRGIAGAEPIAAWFSTCTCTQINYSSPYWGGV